MNEENTLKTKQTLLCHYIVLALETNHFMDLWVMKMCKRGRQLSFENFQTWSTIEFKKLVNLVDN